MGERATQTAPHLAGIDGLRAIACLAVIAHHMAQRIATDVQLPWVQELQAFMLTGSVGVSIFFVLSGFLLSFPFWKRYLEQQEFPEMKRYAVRRAARIMPGYYLNFIISTLLVVAFSVPMEYFWPRVIAGLTFTSGFHYITLFPVESNGLLWSISFEVISYFLMPIFMFALFRWAGKERSFGKGLAFWVGVFAVVLALNQLVHLFFTPGSEGRGWEYGFVGGAKHWMPNYNPIGFFGHFTIGILAAGVAARLFQQPALTSRLKQSGRFDLISLAALVGSFLMLWMLRKAPEFSFSLQNQPFFFPLYALLIGTAMTAAVHSRWVARLLDNRFFRYTSRVSFGLYLWHFLVMNVVSVTVATDYGALGMADLGRWAAISGLVLVVSYLIATLSFHLLEKPVLDWAHGKRRARAVELPPVEVPQG